MFGFLWLFTIYIFWYFSNKSIAVTKCRMSVSVDFFWGPRRWILATTGRFPPREWRDRSDKLKFRFDKSQEVRRGLGENLSLKLWWLLSTVAQAHVIRENTFHLILWYVSLLAWPLDHGPVQILSTYDRASKRGWVSFSVCLVKSCLALLDEPFHSWAFV